MKIHFRNGPVQLHPTMSRQEIVKAIEEALPEIHLTRIDLGFLEALTSSTGLEALQEYILFLAFKEALAQIESKGKHKTTHTT